LNPDCGIEEGCSLQLHIVATPDIPPMYMPKNAAGLILANGNLGSFLSYDLKEIRTFISRDSGYTWNKIADYPAIYETFPLGDLVIYSTYKGRTN